MSEDNGRLFPEVPKAELEIAPRAKPVQKPPIVPGSDWGVIDHVCGKCFARLVGRVVAGAPHYRCTGCGRETTGEPLAMTPGPNGRRAPSICACHMRFGGRDAGIRCVVNPDRTAESPTEVVAMQVL